MRILAALFAIIPSLSYAQDTLTTVTQPPEINYAPGLASILFKLFVSLIVIIGLIYVFIFLLKKIGNKSLPDNSNLIKIIGKSYLTPKQSLYIVKLGSSYVVLGVGENSTSLIKELSPDEVETLQSISEKPKGFQNVLKSVLRK